MKPFFALVLPLLGFSCAQVVAAPAIDYRGDMRDFVARISQTAKAAHPGFLVVPQGGLELLTQNGQSDGSAATGYVTSIDGVGQEDVFYGYDKPNKKTPSDETANFLLWLSAAKRFGLAPLVTDYCAPRAQVVDSYTKNAAQGWISFAANSLELDTVPTYPAPTQPWHSQNGSVASLKAAKNFLYLINPQKYKTHASMIKALAATNYDVAVLDLEGDDGNPLTAAELKAMRVKSGGGTRLLLCYMSIGEAENYRPYWNKSWKPGNPAWLGPTDRDWPGDYAVKYWDTNWQNIILGSGNSYLNQILSAGFDGVYLDKIDEYEYWEEHAPQITTSLHRSE